MTSGMERPINKGKSLASLLFCFILFLVFHFFRFSSQRPFQMLSAENLLMEKMKPFWFGAFFPITAVTEGGKRQERRDCLLVSQLTLTLAAYQWLCGSFGEILLTVKSVMLVDRENFTGPPTFLLISLLILPFTDVLWLTSSYSPPVTSIIVTTTSLFHSGTFKSCIVDGLSSLTGIMEHQLAKEGLICVLN